MGMRLPQKDIPLLLVERQALNEAQEKEHSGAGVGKLFRKCRLISDYPLQPFFFEYDLFFGHIWANGQNFVIFVIVQAGYQTTFVSFFKFSASRG